MVDIPMSGRRLPFARVLAASVFAASCALAATPAAAKYPDNPVRLIVPFAPGGAVDGVGRLTAENLSKQLGEQVVVENRPGAGGVIGIGTVARADPDGYTLLMGNIALTSAPALYTKLTFDPDKDFKGVIVVGSAPYVLAVAPDFPARSVKELIELAKTHPGKYDFSSAGTGSAIHLAGELFKSMARIEIVHVPFKGAGPAAAALLGGQVQMMFGSLGEMMPLIESGKVRALGVTSAKRDSYVPDIPTIQEAGVPGFEVTGWYGLFVPAKTPAAVIATLHDASIKALKTAEMQQQLKNYKLHAVGGSPADADKQLKTETAEWARVVRDAHIQAN
ncbi:MAG TPA: tripartite tricarboxylate transporter substrate binding protein [Bordetella sp.]|jgi:tripartite-type tricarboxylate transporter receptor subunit TctC|nr:tripartite tricarboxylate transporter substrate binding protein [Bordetella sp.]